MTQHVSPAKYVGQTELGAPGATSGGSDEDFAKGTLDMYIDGPWAQSSLEAVSTKYKSQWASFPIPSQNGPNPAPAFAGGSDLGVWAKSPNQAAAWDLVRVMDSPANATTFANLQGFFPEFTSALSGGGYAGSPLMAGFAKAAAYTQISPLNSKNWATADATDAIIPTMMKALMQGRQLHGHREQGQHRAAERAQHRLRILSPPVPAGRRRTAAMAAVRGPAPPRRPDQMADTAVQQLPAARSGSRVGAFVRRHRLAPYLLLVPGAGRASRWCCSGRWSRWSLYSFQNYGLPQLTGAAADPVGRARQLQHHVRRPRVLALAADHGAVRGVVVPLTLIIGHRWSACC